MLECYTCLRQRLGGHDDQLYDTHPDRLLQARDPEVRTQAPQGRHNASPGLDADKALKWASDYTGRRYKRTEIDAAIADLTKKQEEMLK